MKQSFRYAAFGIFLVNVLACFKVMRGCECGPADFFNLLLTMLINGDWMFLVLVTFLMCYVLSLLLAPLYAIVKGGRTVKSVERLSWVFYLSVLWLIYTVIYIQLGVFPWLVRYLGEKSIGTMVVMYAPFLLAFCVYRMFRRFFMQRAVPASRVSIQNPV